MSRWISSRTAPPRSQHTWVLAGIKLKAGETGAVTPAGYHHKSPIDPYKMCVATVASAHMLTWLLMACSMDVEVVRYVDRAYGVLTGLPSGNRWISEVILHPMITLKAGLTRLESSEGGDEDS